MRIAVLFHRLGPYHRVRLEAAGRFGDIWCVEGGGQDITYAWDAVVPGDHFQRLTLFPTADPWQMPPQEVRRAVASALDRIQPAVVAIPGWQDPLALGGLQWALRSGRPVILMSDSHELSGLRSGLREFVKRRIVHFCTAGFVSGTAAADYLVHLGMSRDHIFAGYDVVDNDHFSDGDDSGARQNAQIRVRRGLPTRYFLCSGRFVWEKNLERLLQAYARYVTELARSASSDSRREPWHLVLIGDGPLRGKIEASIRESKLADLVHLPGFVQYPELPNFYRLASACILPSISETWGLVVNEAMASGLPVLVSNRCGCVPDLVREGVNGFTFDPLDAAHLADLMVKVSASGFPLSAFGAAAREIIRPWSPAVFAENLWKAAALPYRSPLWSHAMDRVFLSTLLYGCEGKGTCRQAAR